MIFQKTKYYDSIETLPLYNFDKYRSTKDLNWFIIGYDGRQKKIINAELSNIEKTILDQYFKAIDDYSFINRLKKWGEIETLKTRYFVVKSLVNRLWLGFGDDDMETRLLMIKELKRHGFSMPEINVFIVYSRISLPNAAEESLTGCRPAIPIRLLSSSFTCPKSTRFGRTAITIEVSFAPDKQFF